MASAMARKIGNRYWSEKLLPLDPLFQSNRFNDVANLAVRIGIADRRKISRASSFCSLLTSHRGLCGMPNRAAKKNAAAGRQSPVSISTPITAHRQADQVIGKIRDKNAADDIELEQAHQASARAAGAISAIYMGPIPTNRRSPDRR